MDPLETASRSGTSRKGKLNSYEGQPGAGLCLRLSRYLLTLLHPRSCSRLPPAHQELGTRPEEAPHMPIGYENKYVEEVMEENRIEIDPSQ